MKYSWRAHLQMELALVRCFARYFQQAGQVKLAFEAFTKRNNHPNLFLHPSTPMVSLITFFGKAILKATQGQEHKFTELGQNPSGPTRPFSKQTLKELREVVSKDDFSLKLLKNCFKAQERCHETPTVAKSPWLVDPCPGDIAGSRAGGVWDP